MAAKMIAMMTKPTVVIVGNIPSFSICKTCVGEFFASQTIRMASVLLARKQAFGALTLAKGGIVELSGRSRRLPRCSCCETGAPKDAYPFGAAFP
ncbi:hypothetical protein [Mesorhizobium sp. M0203]|uniref:hypothetical protein n=1 Tax=Mesorhizobium sp. M0203 TaxID=2956912 RepID=UPI0033356442